jgi:hypothetical protein
MNRFKVWMKASSMPEKEKLMGIAGTTLQYLYQLSNSHRTASSLMASILEEGIVLVNKDNPELPSVTKADLSPVCSKCKYFVRCQQ